MDHLHAEESHAVERYLLKELSPGEAEDFERHYFECDQCASAVESGDEFIANARAVLTESPERRNSVAPLKPRQSFFDTLFDAWRQPVFALPVAAALLFGSVSLYQGTVLLPAAHRESDSARSLPAFLLVGATRGEGHEFTVPATSPSFALSVDVPPGEKFRQYACVLSRGTNTLFRVVSPAPPEGQPITMLIPVKGLRSETLELSVFGLGPKDEQLDRISGGSFDLKIQPAR